MVGSNFRDTVYSIYVVVLVITSGFIGFLVIEDKFNNLDAAGLDVIVDCNGGGDYTTIAAGIGGASTGGTVYVWAGEYNETLTITKRVNLIGNGSGDTIINGKDGFNTVVINVDGLKMDGFAINGGDTNFRIYKNNVIFSNNTLENTSMGSLIISDGNNNLIENNHFKEDSGGISISNGQKNIFRNNNVTNDFGINIYLGNSNVIENNTFRTRYECISIGESNSNLVKNNDLSSEYTFGIYISKSNGEKLYGNLLYNCGIRLSDESDLLYWNTHKIDTSNKVNGKPVHYIKNTTGYEVPAGAGQIIIANCTNIKVEDQNCSNGNDGLTIVYSKNNHIANSTFYGNTKSYGIGVPTASILVYYSDSNVFYNLTCSENRMGFRLERSHYNKISNCTISNDEFRAIFLTFSDSTVITNNTLLNNDNGIFLDYALYSEIMYNVINGSNNHGIYTWYADYNKIHNNTITGINISGICMYWSDYNNFSFNDCSHNLNHGLEVYTCYHNEFYSNTFNYNGKHGSTAYFIHYGYFKKNICSYNKGDGFNSDSSYQGRLNIEHNIFSSNENGIYIPKIKEISIFDNIVSYNNKTGIHLDTTSMDNEIYHNNIINNAVQAVDNSGGNNNWNNAQLEGNYWSDYTGVDDGSGTGKHAIANDGIGDTKIPHLGLDNYPMMKYFSWWMPGKPFMNDPGEIDLDGNFTLSWTEAVLASRYLVEEDESPAFTSPVTVHDGSSMMCALKNKPDGEYYYRVKGVNDYVDGDWSDHVNITVDLPPGPPKMLYVKEVTGNDVTLAWQLNAEPDILGYHIFINDTDAGSSGPFHKIQTVDPTTNETTIYDLGENTKYYFAIKAFDNHLGNSSFSNVVNATVLDGTPPAPPVDLNATGLNNTAIQLKWTGSLEPDLAGFIIYMNRTGSGPAGDFDPIHTITGSGTSYTVNGLVEQVQYHFKIQAFDAVPNYSLFSNVASAIPPDLIPPAVPAGLTVSDHTDKSLNLSWDPNSDLDLVGYFIYRSLTVSGTFEQINSEPLTEVEYLDTGLDEDTTYYYKLKAVDDANLTSDFSKAVTGKTLLSPKPPEINMSIENISIPEDSYDDTSIDLLQVFKDPNNDVLTFGRTGNEKIEITIYQANGTVVLKPEHNWNGRETVRFSANDGTHQDITVVVQITVTAVGDPPGPAVITSPEDNEEFTDEDEIDFAGECEDPDLVYYDRLTYSWHSSLDGELGQGTTLDDIVLTQGDHVITMVVIDKDDYRTETSITLKITSSEEKPQNGGNQTGEEKESEVDNLLFLIAMVVAIVAVIMLIILFMYFRKRKSKDRLDSEAEVPGEPGEEPLEEGPVVEVAETTPALAAVELEDQEGPVTKPPVQDQGLLLAKGAVGFTRPVPPDSTAPRLEDILDGNR